MILIHIEISMDHTNTRVRHDKGTSSPGSPPAASSWPSRPRLGQADCDRFELRRRLVHGWRRVWWSARTLDGMVCCAANRWPGQRGKLHVWPPVSTYSSVLPCQATRRMMITAALHQPRLLRALRRPQRRCPSTG